MQDNYNLDNLKPKKKKKIDSRRKGAKFQNDLAKILNGRFNTKDFSSTPGSGAFATTHTLPEHLKIHGDLITPEKFRFCIEAKCGYNKESLYSILDKKSDLHKFIHQSKRDAQAAKKDFLLVFKQDRKPILVVFETSLSDTIFGYTCMSNYLLLNRGNLLMCELKDFLNLPDDYFFIS